MRVEQRAVLSKGQHRVVQRSAPGAFDHPFVNADVQDEPVFARRSAEHFGDRPGYYYAVLHQPGKNLLCRLVIPQCNIAAAVQPGGIARQPGFRKDDKLCAERSCFIDE